MPDWQTTWMAIRSQFLARACHRLAKTASAIETLGVQPANHDLLSELKRDMHWLIGVGGTYKLPVLTQLGEEGEEICLSCIERGNVLPGDAKRMSDIIDRAQSAVRQEVRDSA